MILSYLFCDPVASTCRIVSVRKPTGTRAIAEEFTTSSKKSDNQRLWVEQSIGVLGKSTPDNLVSEPQQVALKGLNRRTKEEVFRSAAVSKVGHQKFTEKWDSLHPTACCVVSTTSFI